MPKENGNINYKELKMLTGTASHSIFLVGFKVYSLKMNP